MRRVERGEEAGPAGAGIELGAGAEQGQRAQPAAVDALALVVEEHAAERRFGAVLQQHAAFLAAEAGDQGLGLGGGGGRQVEGGHGGAPWVDGLGMPENVGVPARACKCDGRSWVAHGCGSKVGVIDAGACHEADPSPAVDRPVAGTGAGPGAHPDPTATRSATTVAPQPVAPPPQAARPQPQLLPTPQPAQPIKSTGPARSRRRQHRGRPTRSMTATAASCPACARPARTACSTRAPAATTTACRPAMASRSSAEPWCHQGWLLAGAERAERAKQRPADHCFSPAINRSGATVALRRHPAAACPSSTGSRP